MSAHRHSESPPLAAAAMPLPELERWLQDRATRRPVATNVPMLDGYVAAIVAGPASIDPLDWICPLLAVDAEAFNHGGTPEFAAICAVARRHNDISHVVSSTPNGSNQCIAASPMAKSIRVPGAEDSTLPCGCRCRIGRRCSISATSTTGCSCPFSCTVATTTGVRCSDHLGGAARPGNFYATPTPISQPSSRPCANTGCRPATQEQADCAYVGPLTGYGRDDARACARSDRAGSPAGVVVPPRIAADGDEMPNWVANKAARLERIRAAK